MKNCFYYNHFPFLSLDFKIILCYNIKDNNFFKLRDLGDLFDFNVSWDGERGCIIVNTAESYDPSN